MDEYLNDFEGAEVQEPAEPDTAEDITEAVEIENEETGAEDVEPAVPQETGRTQADAAFAELRRRAEQAERGNAEAEQRISRMTELLNRLGFRGGDADSVTDDAVAHLEQTTPEAVKQQRLQTQYENMQRQAVMDELHALREMEAERNLQADLKAFGKIDPSVKTAADLEQKYPNYLRALSGISGQEKANPEVRELLFRAEFERQSAKAVKAPAKVGKVNAKTNVEKEYFSNDELDKLTAKDLDDPKVLEKAIKSMEKIKSV